MSEQHVEPPRAPELGDGTKGADTLRAQLAEQNGEIPQGSSPAGAAFSEALRNAVTDIRVARKRFGDDIDFEAQFRNKLFSLAAPGALEYSLLPLSLQGKRAAFIPIVVGHKLLGQVEKFLQQELKLDQKAARRLVKPPLFSWRKSDDGGLITALPVTEQASPWLRQIIKDNSEIQGANVGLALLKRKDSLQIGLLVSLEAAEPLQVGKLAENAKKQAPGAGVLTSIGEAIGPLRGMIQNVIESLQVFYLAATAERKGVYAGLMKKPTENFVSDFHHIAAYTYTFGTLTSGLAYALLGLQFNPSNLALYAGAVVATNLLSLFYESGRKKWQSSSAKRVDDEKKKQ
jgi:hypothetical protein